MDAAGFFGKLPSERDFVFHGLPAPLTEAWSVRVAGWMQVGLQASGETSWKAHFLGSPVWRFVLPQGLPEAGEALLAGLMAGSIDGAGRLFPFTVLLARPAAPGSAPRLDLVDRILDGIEPAMLAYLDGLGEQRALVDALSQAHQAFHRLPDESVPLPPLLLPGEQAALLLHAQPPWSGNRVQRSFGLGDAHGEGVAGQTLWWHDGLGETMAPQCLVCRDMPTGAAAIPLFCPILPGPWRQRMAGSGGGA